MGRGGKIRIWTLAVESYRFVLTHPRDLVRVGWLPLLAIFALNLFYRTGNPVPDFADLATFWPKLRDTGISTLAQTLVAVVILVAWHRVVLLGTGGRRGPLEIRLGTRELRYLLVWLLISLLFLVMFAIAFFLMVAAGFAALVAVQAVLTMTGTTESVDLGQLEQFVWLQYAAVLPAFLLASYFTTRLSLVLPAMATDKERSLVGSWSMSAGNGWRLVVASLIVILPAELLSLGIARVMQGVSETGLYYLLALAASLTFLLLIVSAGTVLSLFSVALDQQAASGS